MRTKIAILAAMAALTLLAGCGGGSGNPGTTPGGSTGFVTVADNGDGTYTLMQGQTKLDTFSVPVYNWVNTGASAGWLLVSRKDGVYNVTVDPEMKAAPVAVQITGSAYQYYATFSMKKTGNNTIEGTVDEGYMKYKLPEGSYTLAYDVNAYDASGVPVISSFHREVNIKAAPATTAPAPAPTTPSLTLEGLGGGNEVTVGTTVTAVLANADMLQVVQPDGLVLTMVPNDGKVVFTASQTGAYKLTPHQGATKGTTVTLNVKAAAQPAPSQTFTGPDPSETRVRTLIFRGPQKPPRW